MSVRGRFKPVNPDVHYYTAEITMSLGEWKGLYEQIREGVGLRQPAGTVLDIIDDLVRLAEKEFETEHERGYLPPNVIEDAG